MSEALSNEALKAIRERCEGAITAGPWTVGSLDENMVFRNAPPFNDRLIAETENAWDAEFIAHSRTDIPALLAEIERLKAENANLRAAGRVNHPPFCICIFCEGGKDV